MTNAASVADPNPTPTNSPKIINVDLDDVSPEVLEAVKMVILTTASEEIETALLRLVDGGSLPSLPQALDIWRRMTDQGGSRTEEEEGGGFAACRRCTYHNRKADPEVAGDNTNDNPIYLYT